MIVVGSQNSSNSKRLKEVAAGRGVESYLVDSAAEIDAVWLVGKQRIGISAGASAPEILVEQVIARIQASSQAQVTNLLTAEESVSFPLPRELA